MRQLEGLRFRSLGFKDMTPEAMDRGIDPGPRLSVSAGPGIDRKIFWTIGVEAEGGGT